MKHCTKCGATLSDAAAFCRQCGTPVRAPVGDDKRRGNKQGRQRNKQAPAAGRTSPGHDDGPVPQSFWPLLAFIVQRTQRTFLAQLPLSITIGALTLVVHSYLLVVLNDGFAKRGAYAPILALEGQLISGSVLWGVAASLLTGLLMRMRGAAAEPGFGTRLAATMRYVRSARLDALAVLAGGVGFALVSSALLSDAVSVVAAFGVGALLASRAGGIVSLLLRSAWSSLFGTLRWQQVREHSLAVGYLTLLASGLGFAVNATSAFGLPAGAAMLTAALVLVVAGRFVSTGRVSGFLLLGAIAFAVMLLGEAGQVLAHDGGWAESDGNFWTWVGNGAGTAIGYGGGPTVAVMAGVVLTQTLTTLGQSFPESSMLPAAAHAPAHAPTPHPASSKAQAQETKDDKAKPARLKPLIDPWDNTEIEFDDGQYWIPDPSGKDQLIGVSRAEAEAYIREARETKARNESWRKARRDEWEDDWQARKHEHEAEQRRKQEQEQQQQLRRNDEFDRNVELLTQWISKVKNADTDRIYGEMDELVRRVVAQGGATAADLASLKRWRGAVAQRIEAHNQRVSADWQMLGDTQEIAGRTMSGFNRMVATQIDPTRGVLTGAIFGAAENWGPEKSWAQIGGHALWGAAMGKLSQPAAGATAPLSAGSGRLRVVVSVVQGGGVAGAESLGHQVIGGKGIDAGQIAWDALLGGFLSGLNEGAQMRVDADARPGVDVPSPDARPPAVEIEFKPSGEIEVRVTRNAESAMPRARGGGIPGTSDLSSSRLAPRRAAVDGEAPAGATPRPRGDGAPARTSPAGGGDAPAVTSPDADLLTGSGSGAAVDAAAAPSAAVTADADGVTGGGHASAADAGAGLTAESGSSAVAGSGDASAAVTADADGVTGGGHASAADAGAGLTAESGSGVAAGAGDASATVTADADGVTGGERGPAADAGSTPAAEHASGAVAEGGDGPAAATADPDPGSGGGRDSSADADSTPAAERGSGADAGESGAETARAGSDRLDPDDPIVARIRESLENDPRLQRAEAAAERLREGQTPDLPDRELPTTRDEWRQRDQEIGAQGEQPLPPAGASQPPEVAQLVDSAPPEVQVRLEAVDREIRASWREAGGGMEAEGWSRLQASIDDKVQRGVLAEGDFERWADAVVRRRPIDPQDWALPPPAETVIRKKD